MNNLAETGWRDFTNSSGTHYFRLFNEYQVSGATHVDLYASRCAVDGMTVTMKLEYPGSGGYWNAYYACGGGGFNQLGGGIATTFGAGSPRVETFRFGPPGSGGFILDYHNNIQYRVGSVWRNFGSMRCERGMSDTYGVPNGNPATSWTTTDVGSC